MALIVLAAREKRLLNRHLNLVVDNPDLVCLDWDHRRKGFDFAGAHIERGAVQRTLDDVPIEFALGERRLFVGAGVINREKLAVDVDDGDAPASDLYLLHRTGLNISRLRDRPILTHCMDVPSNVRYGPR